MTARTPAVHTMAAIGRPCAGSGAVTPMVEGVPAFADGGGPAAREGATAGTTIHDGSTNEAGTTSAAHARATATTVWRSAAECRLRRPRSARPAASTIVVRTATSPIM